VPGLLGRRDSALDVLVGSVSYPELLDKLSESRIFVITLFKSIWLISSIVSVSSLISSIEVVRFTGHVGRKASEGLRKAR
jgi:hypothetical protein